MPTKQQYSLHLERPFRLAKHTVELEKQVPIHLVKND